MKPIDHSKATATVTIDGLGICCFDQRTKKWQVGLLREPNHVLTLKIKGMVSPPIEIPVGVRRIQISTVNAEPPDYAREYPGGCYDRGPVNRHVPPNTPADSENMRWAVDLRNPADVNQTDLELESPTYGVTMMEISNALFYVAEPFKSDLFRVPFRQNPNGMTNPEVQRLKFGRTSDLLGADIVCRDGGEVVVDIEGDTYRLQKRPGNPWEIDFRNMDRPAKATVAGEVYAEGDFRMYYDAVNNARIKYGLWGIPPLTEGERTDCNTVWLSGPADNLDSLAT